MALAAIAFFAIGATLQESESSGRFVLGDVTPGADNLISWVVLDSSTGRSCRINEAEYHAAIDRVMADLSDERRETLDADALRLIDEVGRRNARNCFDF